METHTLKPEIRIGDYVFIVRIKQFGIVKTIDAQQPEYEVRLFDGWLLCYTREELQKVQIIPNEVQHDAKQE